MHNTQKTGSVPGCEEIQVNVIGVFRMSCNFWLCCLVAAGAVTSTLGDDPPAKDASATAPSTPQEKDARPEAGRVDEKAGLDSVTPTQNEPLKADPEAKKAEKPDPVLTPVAGLKKIALPSGVKYWDIKVGEGEATKPHATVVAHYSSWLEDGTLFDTSVTRQRPSRFELDTIVPGFAEGITSMKVGGRRRIEVPPEMGYGPGGSSPRVPPNATLVYEVELFEVMQPVVIPKPGALDGVKPVRTASGLTYWDIKTGTGESPRPDSIVSLEYSGWLTDGKLFHSTLQEGRPETFRLDKVIPGMTEGTLSMKVGGKRRLVVPPELGYGVKGLPGHVPPSSLLVFEIDLLSVKPPPPKPVQTKVTGIKPVVTPSGLKYWDIKVGDGVTPDAVSTVTMHYIGWLEDGTVFDSSVERGQPIRDKTRKMIKGMREAVETMKAGGKRRLEIPYQLGYGEEGMPPTVPPKAKLIYEVELLGVEY